MTQAQEKAVVRDMYNDGEYKKHNADWHTADSPWKAVKIDEILSRNHLTPAHICEVGCGAGEILRQLSLKDRYQDTHFTGYEVSQDAFTLCQERRSERVHFLHKDLLSEDVSYDALLCIDVFEHVDDYMGFLRKLKDKAEYKVFHIPLDISIAGLLRNKLIEVRHVLGHLHHFIPETALATLEDCGYEIVDQMFTPSFAEIPPRSLKAKLARPPRQLLYAISPKLMSKTLGGCSLMVLAK